MTANINLLDVVALTEDVPTASLRRSQVGTVVEILDPDAFEVEFSDNHGRTYAALALHAAQLLVLHYHRVRDRFRECRFHGFSEPRAQASGFYLAKRNPSPVLHAEIARLI